MRHFTLTWSLMLLLTAVATPVFDARAAARAGEKKAQLCLLCHKVESPTVAPTLEQQPAKYLVAQTNLFKAKKRSGPEMQANVARLSAKDIQDISDYFSSQRAKPAQFATDPDPKTVALGEASAKQLNCANCHSEDYRGAKDVPRLAGQKASYLQSQIAEFKRGARPHPMIPAAGEKLTDPTITALSAYFAKLEP